jgi:hypothetical protein
MQQGDKKESEGDLYLQDTCWDTVQVKMEEKDVEAPQNEEEEENVKG